MFFSANMDGVRCIYSTESMQVIFVKNNGEQSEKFTNISFHDLQKNYPQAATNINDVPVVKDDLSERPIRTLYLSLTYRCNLNCIYCICHNSFGVEKMDMTNDTLDHAIKKFTELSSENTEREIVLYGGEPTLRKDLIKEAYVKCREQERLSVKNLSPARFILCTNGTLIDQEFCEFLKTTNIYPAVSIDGGKELHNELRKFANGTGSYDDSLRGYRLLQKNNIPAGITMTLGSYNVENLPEYIKYVDEVLNPHTLAINTLLDYDSEKNPHCATPESAKLSIWKTFLAARETGTYIVKHIMDNRVKPFVEMRPRIWGCTGTGARMAVTPEGKTVSCMALAKRSIGCNISSVKSQADFIEPYMKESSPLVSKNCKDCVAKATCGGMCPATLKLNNMSEDKNFCDATKYFTEHLLGLLFDLHEEKIKAAIAKDGYFVPSKDDRKALYGKISVDQSWRDFQFSPNW